MLKEALEIFLQALDRMLQAAHPLLRSLSLLLVLLLILAAALYSSPSNGWNTLLVYLLLGYAHVMVAINTHRVLLMDAEQLPRWGNQLFGMRELMFSLYTIGITLACILPGMLVYIPFVGWVLALIGIAFVVARFSLVLPAIATDRKWTFATAWEASEPHQWVLMILLMGVPVLLGLAESLLALIPYSAALLWLFSMFTTVLVIAVLSVAFERYAGTSQ